jgi:hypothetical protein
MGHEIAFVAPTKVFSSEVAMTRALLALFVAILSTSTAAAEKPLSTQEALIARAKSLELGVISSVALARALDSAMSWSLT